MTPQIKQRIEQIQRGEVPERYEKTTAGIIPSTWHTFSLGDLYTERKESGIPSLPILTVSIHSGVSDGALDDDEIGKKVKRIEDKTQYRTARSGDVVFNMMRAWQGAIGVVRQDGLVSPAYIVATPNEAVYPPFMDYCLKTPQMINRLHRKSYGVTDFRLRLYWDSFAKVDCVLPPFAEQKKIAEILSAQDKLIVSKEKLIEEKKRQKKALMQQLLTGKKRLPGFSGEWKKQKMSDILCERKEENKDQSLRICSVAVNSGVVDQREHLGKSMAASDTSNYNVVHYGDIVYTKSPTGAFPYGIVKQSQLTENVAVSPLYGVYEPTSYEIGYLLNEYFMYSNNANGYLLPIINKGAKNTINISNATFITPSLYLPIDYEEIKKLVQIFKIANKEIEILRKDLDQEKQKKKALMQLLLTGIVRV